MKVMIPFTMAIDVYSHYFRVKVFSTTSNSVVWALIHEFVQVSHARNDNDEDKVKVFAAKTKDKREFRFHIGQLKRFKEIAQARGIIDSDCVYTYHDFYKPAEYIFKLNPKYQLRDYQEEAKQFALTFEEGDLNSRLICMPTGTGKTVTAAFVDADIGHRVLMYLLPKYVEKWVSDLKELFGLKDKHILNVSGSDELRGLIELAQNKQIKEPVIIISQNTMNNFIKFYENNPPEEVIKHYGCLPENLCELLKVGIINIDEIHENLHMVFKILLYSHVPRLVSLSATFLSEDPFMDKIQKTMFPMTIRFDKIKMKRYIKATAVRYNFKDFHPDKIRTTEWGSNTYSHVAFEKSIMRNKQYQRGYLDLVDHLIQVGYLDDYQKGDKAIIYAATVKMCEIMAGHFKKKYEHLDVRTYVAKDPYENVIEADMRFTTMQSAGAAIDIPQLTLNVPTVMMFSHKANLQCMGRLRELAGREVRYMYPYCGQLKKQVKGHEERQKLLRTKVAGYRDMLFPYPV